MDIQDKTKEELISEIKELLHEIDSLKALKENREEEFLIANKELVFQNKEKGKRAAELILANKELAFQNEEKEKHAAELIIANKELVFQNKEKEKRAEELARNKQLLDEVGRLARIGGWEFDLKKNKLSWSDVVYQIHEIEPDCQPTVESGINFYTPESISVISEAVRQAIEEGKSFDLNLQLITAKQNRIWVREIGQAYRVNGEIVKIGGVFQDITERKQAEETLDQERILLRTIIDNFPNSIFVKDKKYRKIVANLEHASRVTAHLGPAIPFSAEDLLGKTDFEVYPRELAEEFFIEDQKVIEGGQSVLNRELLSINMNGRNHWELISKIPLRDRNGEIIGLVGISTDITGRKRMEEALSQSEENFRSSITESILGIRIVTVDEKTIYANKAFLDIFEFNSLEEFTSTPAINRYTPESYAQHQERKEKRKNGYEAFDYEISIVRENAEIRHVKVSRKEVLWNGIKHYQVINLDITEQKKLTFDLIEAKEHAEQSDRLKSAFLANMSHEIRTPMNGILGFAGLLKEPDLSGLKQQEYIRIIEKSGARMLNIINDIVDISKIEAGLMKVDIKDTNIKEKLEFLYIFFRPQVEEKRMQLFFRNTLSTKEATIRTDSAKGNSILTNLVKNAIKYSEEGAIEFGYIKKDETLEFYVKDTGIGIPKDRQSAIFERFIQADITDKMARQGAGLGLSISKAYVEMLGGKIWVESEEGIGSTFYFTLPYNAEPEEKKVVGKVVPAQNEKNQIKDLKILIAEDDETSEMLITIGAEKFGKEILKARTGFEAVEVCRNNPDTDLILMDILMPVMNGYEATRQIRQFNKDVVVIAQTAFGRSGDREKAIEAGCNGYISKPINKDELLSLIQKYFKK